MHTVALEDSLKIIREHNYMNLFAFVSVLMAGIVVSQRVAIEGHPAVWHPVTLTFQGPEASETDCSPNPFLDIRLQVVFTGPSGQRLKVCGFFDGDGVGGPKGRACASGFPPTRRELGTTRRVSARGAVLQFDRNQILERRSSCPISPARLSCPRAIPMRGAF